MGKNPRIALDDFGNELALGHRVAIPPCPKEKKSVGGFTFRFLFGYHGKYIRCSGVEEISHSGLRYSKAFLQISWPISAAARLLVIKRTTLYRKMKKYGLVRRRGGGRFRPTE